MTPSNGGAAPISPSLVTENDNNFHPFALTPIHEAPARSRLHTAETDLVQNFKKTMNTAMAAAVKAPTITALRRNHKSQSSFHDDEASSVVSSLSKDDSLLARPPIVPSSNTGATTPPTEVSIPCEANSPFEETPDWLSLQQTRSCSSADLTRPSLISRDASAPAVLMAHNGWNRPTAAGPRGGVHHVRTSLLSPKILRPTHGRNQSCPRMDFSVASSTLDSSGSSLDALFSQDGTSPRSMSPNSMRLLGNRKRLTHHRRSKSSTTAYSGGCHASLTTAPTVASSSTMTAGSFHKQSKEEEEEEEDDTTVSTSRMMRKRNVVKEELKYVMNLVSTPIMKLPLLKKVDTSPNVDLTRADGCLT